MEKLAQAGEGGGARPPHVLNLPARTKLLCTLQLIGQITEYTELQPLLSGIHSIMMEKLA